MPTMREVGSGREEEGRQAGSRVQQTSKLQYFHNLGCQVGKDSRKDSFRRRGGRWTTIGTKGRGMQRLSGLKL